MVVDNWSMCPKCIFPALHTQFIAHLESDPTCPMCEQPLDAKLIELIAPADIRLGEPSIDNNKNNSKP